MTNHPEHQIGLLAEATGNWQNEGGSVEPQFVRFSVDESPITATAFSFIAWMQHSR
jgi:hypothetical protein